MILLQIIFFSGVVVSTSVGKKNRNKNNNNNNNKKISKTKANSRLFF